MKSVDNPLDNLQRLQSTLKGVEVASAQLAPASKAASVYGKRTGLHQCAHEGQLFHALDKSSGLAEGDCVGGEAYVETPEENVLAILIFSGHDHRI